METGLYPNHYISQRPWNEIFTDFKWNFRSSETFSLEYSGLSCYLLYIFPQELQKNISSLHFYRCPNS